MYSTNVKSFAINNITNTSKPQFTQDCNNTKTTTGPDYNKFMEPYLLIAKPILCALSNDISVQFMNIFNYPA